MFRLFGGKENIGSDGVKNFFSDRANRDLEVIYLLLVFQYKENSKQRYIEKRNYSRNTCLCN